jgi:hypothetical protein
MNPGHPQSALRRKYQVEAIRAKSIRENCISISIFLRSCIHLDIIGSSPPLFSSSIPPLVLSVPQTHQYIIVIMKTTLITLVGAYLASTCSVRFFH